MSYSLNNFTATGGSLNDPQQQQHHQATSQQMPPLGSAAAATNGLAPHTNNNNYVSSTNGKADTVLKKMPRVILHPNGRPVSCSLPMPSSLASSPPTTATRGTTAAAAAHAVLQNQQPQQLQQRRAKRMDGGGGGAVHPLPDVHSGKKPLANGNDHLTAGSADSVGLREEVLLLRTEEHMQEIERKLEAMHADIRLLANGARSHKISSAPTAPVSHPSKCLSLSGSTSSSQQLKTNKQHHLSPLASNNSSKTNTAVEASAKPTTASTGKHAGAIDHNLTLGEEVVLSSPDGSSSDDDSGDSSSASSTSSAEEETDSSVSGNNNKSSDGRTKKLAGGGFVPTRPPTGTAAAGGGGVRQGFGFKRPPATAAAGATAKSPARGIQMAGGAADPVEDGSAGKKLSSAGSASILQSDSSVSSPVRLGRAAASRVSDDEGHRRGRLFTDAMIGDSEHDNAKAVDGLDTGTRRRSHAVRSLREHFFAPVPRLDEVLGGGNASDNAAVASIMLPGTPCSWLCCVSLAISFVAGVPTTVEKVLKANHLGMHYLGLQAVTLAQLYDLTSDYIHTRFHRTAAYNASCEADEFEDDVEGAQALTEEEVKLLPHVHCEQVTMDNEIIDPVEESDASYGMGEHAPVKSLAQLRKELLAHNNDEKSLFMLNYDPYVIEEYETRLRANNAESEEEEAAIWAGMRHKKGRSQGAFGLLASFNPVLHTVTIVAPHLTKEQYPMHEQCEGDLAAVGVSAAETKKHFARFLPVLSNLVLEEHTISLPTLYEALRQKDNYTQLCRGFVRVFISEDFEPKVPSIFPLFVLDGSSAAGLMTSTLDVSIAPHVLGLAMMHHLSITFLLSDSARRKQSSRNLISKANVCDVKLRGIPLTKICQQLRLPLSMIVGQSNKESIAMAYAWYTTFLQQLQVGNDVRLGLVRPSRRNGAEDGQPSITEEEFLSHLKTAVATRSVILISFDINVALNVRITTSDGNNSDPAHFAIVIGVDEERGIIRLADVNVKRFRKTWHIPFFRLYNAVMGYGYMVAATEKKTIKALGGKRFQEEALASGRYALPPMALKPVDRFEYPSKAYAVTVLADAVCRLGFRADVERMLNYSGFHISYFLSRHLPLEGATFVLQNFSHYALDDAMSVAITHYDYTEDSHPPVVVDGTSRRSSSSQLTSAAEREHPIRTANDLLSSIRHALASPATRQLIVKFDPHVIASDPQVFNGSTNGGSFGIVLQYDERTNVVVLSNCDPDVFYRTFAVPLPLLFKAASRWDNEDMRALGTVLLTTDVNQESLYENTKGYDFAHALVHHPFRPVFSAACSCLALAATEMMMSIETPTLLGGAPLAVEEEEKRRYKRYNNVFSAEDILYALPEFSVHDWQARGNLNRRSADLATNANAAFKQLRLPLVAFDITHGAKSYRTGHGANANKDGSGDCKAMDHLPSEDALASPEAFLNACNGVSGLLTITLIAYDTDPMYGVPGTSVGIVNRVDVFDAEEEEEERYKQERRRASSGGPDPKGSVQLLDGEPCRWGAVTERSVETLMPMVYAILCIMEVE